MLFRPFWIASPLLACLACTQGPQFPETGVSADRTAPFPELIALDRVLAAAPGAPAITPATSDTFAGRLAQLRARAAALSAPVVDPATRDRMRGAIGRAALR